MLRINCAGGPYFCMETDAAKNDVLKMMIQRSAVSGEITIHQTIDDVRVLMFAIALCDRLGNNSMEITHALHGCGDFWDLVRIYELMDYFGLGITDYITSYLCKISVGTTAEYNYMKQMLSNEKFSTLCFTWIYKASRNGSDSIDRRVLDNDLKIMPGYIHDKFVKHYIALGGLWSQKIENQLGTIKSLIAFRKHRDGAINLYEIYDIWIRKQNRSECVDWLTQNVNRYVPDHGDNSYHPIVVGKLLSGEWASLEPLMQ